MAPEWWRRTLGDDDSTRSGGELARLEVGRMGDENRQLRELHDTYAWEVNAAVGEGRLDLVWQLADEYLDQAVALITGGESTWCGRTDCAVCHRPRPAPSLSRPLSRRRRWSRRARRADAD